MTWITISDDDKPIIEEIEKQTDRGAAIIASAYLEERLLAAIKARTNRHDKIESAIYKGSGPLASFSAKIDLGLLLGIYTPKLHSFLHTIRDIRNEFAHKSKPRNFSSQRIKDLSKNLYVVATFKMMNKTTGQVTGFELKDVASPRETFLNCVKFLLVCLDMETKQLPLRSPAPPVIPPPEQRPKTP
jgi:DNA-binding MltR family transcriptional regulator